MVIVADAVSYVQEPEARRVSIVKIAGVKFIVGDARQSLAEKVGLGKKFPWLK